MQGSKDDDWADNNGLSAETDSNDAVSEIETRAAPPSEVDRWQQYRQWISKAPAPTGRRTGVDPYLYTWKGYRNWSEQIKRNWSDN